MIALLLVLAAQTADAARPLAPTAVIDFAPLFVGDGVSRSVLTKPIDKGLMERVLLSPNLVFESSRSSLLEPPTVGPEPFPGSPNLPNALGHAVDIRASSVLLEYLAGKGSVLIAPAVTRRWSWEWWCSNDKNCPQTTWVERLLLMKQKVQKPDGDGKSGVVAGDDAVRLSPTSMLAVRDLGQASQRTFVVVQQGASPDQLIARLPQKRGEPNLCPGLQVELPVTSFSAEILSMNDGRIIARIDEARFPKLASDLRARIALKRYEPVRQTETIPGKAPFCGCLGDPEPPTQREYIASYTPVDTTCEQVAHAMTLVQDSVSDQLNSKEVLKEVLKTSLDALY